MFLIIKNEQEKKDQVGTQSLIQKDALQENGNTKDKEKENERLFNRYRYYFFLLINFVIDDEPNDPPTIVKIIIQK